MYKIILCAFIGVCVSLSVFGQDFLKTSGTKIVNANGENVLLKGIGLGGWMLQEGYMLHLNSDGQQYKIRERIEALIGPKRTEEFYDSWLKNNTTKRDIDSLKAWGFNSVRLVMNFKLFTLPSDLEPVAGQQTWREKGFALTDSLVKWCKADGIYIILDLHAAPGGQGNDANISDRDPNKPSLWQNPADQEKTVALWKEIAKRYANEATIAGYDILNEPNWGFTDPVNDKNGMNEPNNAPLKQLMVAITKAIREVDPNHIIIIEGNGWGNNYRGILDQGLWDKNIVLSFHKYWNFTNPQSIEQIIGYRSRLNVPVWVGETGENSNVWYADDTRLLESNNIGWSMWPLKKLGINNPLEIKSNAIYDQLVKYWQDRQGNLPNEETIYKALMGLAESANIKYNLVHRDVIDAMIRQPFSNNSIPFASYRIKQATEIPAVNYDLGRNNIAYFDRDTANYRSSGINSAGNRGGAYRNDGVDIFNDKSIPGVYYVGSIEDGEWLQYTFTVEVTGNYLIAFTTRNPSSNGKLQLTDNDKLVIDELKLSQSDAEWKQTNPMAVQLKKGLHRFRVRAVTGGFDLRSFNISPK